MLLVVALPAIVAGRFAGAALPAAMGTVLAGYPLGIGLGFVALPLVGSWRAAMAATAVLALLALAAAAASLPRPTGGPAGPRGSRPSGKEAAAVVAAGLVWGCPNAGFAALLGFAPVFFVGQGMPAQVAGALVSLVAFATVPTGPVGGWLVGRLPSPVVGIAGCLAFASVAMALLAQGVAPAVLLVATGVALGTASGPIVALPAAVLAPEHRAVGMGLFWLVYFAPLTLLPPLAGLARDLTGAAAAPLNAAAVFTALGLAALAGYVGARRRPVLAAAPPGSGGAPD